MKKATRRIPLTQHKFAIVDAIDYDFLMKRKWCADKSKRKTCPDTYYAQCGVCRDGKWTSMKMHRAVAFRMGLPKSCHYDHKDRNGLNNRRSNIRKCTRSKNGANMRKRSGTSSKYKGVFWVKSKRRWRARITVDGRRYHIGDFKSEWMAHLAYKNKANEKFGEFAFS